MRFGGRGLPLVAALLWLAAGCTTTAPPPTDSSDPTSAPPSGDRVLPWGFTDCDMVAYFTAVPAEALAPFLPPGFRSLSLQELAIPTAPPTTQLANFGAEMLDCREARGLRTNITDGSYGSYFTAVEPPAELFNASHGLHFIKFDVLIADPDLRAELDAAGVPAVGGSASFVRFGDPTGTAPTGAPIPAEGSIYIGAGGAGLFDGAGLAPYPDPPASFDEFAPLPDGGWAISEATVLQETILAGPGTFQPPANSIASAILGTTNPVPGVFIVMDGAHFVDARYTLTAA